MLIFLLLKSFCCDVTLASNIALSIALLSFPQYLISRADSREFWVLIEKEIQHRLMKGAISYKTMSFWDILVDDEHTIISKDLHKAFLTSQQSHAEFQKTIAQFQ